MNSKTDRRTQSKNRSVGDAPHSGVNWINHAAARAKDILEIGLNDPAGTDLRLIGNFECELIGADRQGFACEKSRVSIKGADRWGELRKGCCASKCIIRSLLPNPYKIDSSLCIKVHQIAIRRAHRNTRKSAYTFFWTFAGQAPKHLIDYAIDAKIAEMDERPAVASLAHCLAGDATGIILGAMLTYRFRFPNGIDLILEYTAAFLFGWMIFQALFMRSMLSGDYALALRKTFFAEFVSMNMVMVGMIPTMVILMHALPELRNPLHPLFWGVMSVATLAGGVTAYPINSWMVRRGIKHGMMSAPQKVVPAIAAMKSLDRAMPMSASGGMHTQHATPMSLARQAQLVALTLAALAVAVWLTARVAPIRL